MEQNILIAVGVFSIICVVCVAAIGLSMVKQNEKLKEKVKNDKKPMYNVWISSLSNNLPVIYDNQHGKETKGKRYPDDFIDFAKKMSFKLSDLKPTERDVALSIQKQFFDSHKYELNEIINDLIEKNKIQSDKFEAKEKMYVEKIRQLEKILADEEIKVSDCGKVTNLKADKLKYEKFELNLEKSHLQNEVERLNSLLELNEQKYVNLLDFVIFKHKNGITTVDIDFKKTREKIEKLIEESNKKSK